MKSKDLVLPVMASVFLFYTPGCMDVERTVKEPKKEQRKIVSLEQILPKLRGELIAELENRMLTGEEVNQWTFEKLKENGIVTDYSGLAPDVVDSFKDKLIENTNIRENYGLRNDYYILKNPQNENPITLFQVKQD